MGAGDTFDAALIYAFSLGRSPAECVRFANYSAGYAISRERARQIPTPKMISEYWERNI